MCSPAGRRARGRARTPAHRAELFSAPRRHRKDGAYDLSINRYKETVHEEVEHESPAVIIAELKKLEAEIADGLAKLEEMLA